MRRTGTVVALCLALATAGCGHASPAHALVGRWVAAECPPAREHEGDVVEFRSDGTLLENGRSARYEVLDGNRLRIEGSGRPAVSAYALSGDELTLTYEGQTCTFRREVARPAP